MTTFSSLSIVVSHSTMNLDVAFDNFIRELEHLAGRFDPTAFRQGADAVSTAQLIQNMEGEQGLMIFAKQDHGLLLTLHGAPRKALRYHIGNPMIAFSMTKLDVRAGLYAPLTVLVYDIDAQTTGVEFDLPSTLFGQFGNADVTKVGLELDAKLTKLIEKAVESAKASA
jgi:hypothetical protein